MSEEKNTTITFVENGNIEIGSKPQDDDKKPDKRTIDKITNAISKVKWSNVIVLTTLHVLFVVGFIHCLKNPVKFYTILFTVLTGLFSGLGNAIGAHRLWAHRSFKARLPLRILLALLQTMTMNGSCYSYARDHRTHHKYSDTEGDPKNPGRGLFFSHMGWWMLKKTKTTIEHGQKLDFSDLKKDKVCWYQHRFYTPLYLVFGLAIPWAIPVYCWNEDILVAFYVSVVLRTAIILHHYFTVNSISHFFGYRPYDYRMRPAENRLVMYLSVGEGNHNFHHTFPYDYSSCDKKLWESFNPGTLFIDLFALLGLAYDCKKASPAVIEGTIKRIGVPAYFDPPRSLLFRIVIGVLDWICGLLVDIWIVYPFAIYKYFDNQPFFVY